MFTIKCFFTNREMIQKNFKKLATAQKWVEKIGHDLTKTIDRFESDGPTLEELGCEPVVHMSVSPGAALREDHPEPNFVTEDDTLDDIMRSVDPLSSSDFESNEGHVQAIFDFDEIPSISASIGHDDTVTLHAVRSFACEPVQTEPARCSHIVCNRCNGTGRRSWVPTYGPDAGKLKEGDCFRCASTYKQGDAKGKLTAEDFRRNQVYDRSKEGLSVTIMVRMLDQRTSAVGFAKMTELYRPDGGPIRAEEAKVGQMIYVASTLGDFVALEVAQVDIKKEPVFVGK